MGADNQRTLLRFDAMEALLKTYGAGVSPWKRPQPTRMTWGRHASRSLVTVSNPSIGYTISSIFGSRSVS